MNKNSILISSISLLLVLLLSSAYRVNKDQLNEQADTLEVNWISFEEAVEKSKTEKRKIFIDVYTDWCGWCKVMDKKTFSEPAIASYLNEYYYAVKLNAEQTEDIQFREHTFKYVPNGRRGYHELAVSLLQGKLSYPTVVFMDENFNFIQALPGYRKPEEFHRILTFFGQNQFREMKWDEYQKVYESPYN